MGSHITRLIQQLTSGLSHRRVPLAALALAALLVAGGTVGVLLTRGGNEDDGLPQDLLESTFTMTAVKTDAIGVDLDTDFLLASETETDAAFVRSLLRVEPAVEFDVQQQNATSFRIDMREPLEPGRVYRFSLAVEASAPNVLGSWAFQTKSPISVVQTLPRHQSTFVPLNTGIELTWSHDNVENLAGHFEIDPPVEGRFDLHRRVAVFVPEELSAGTLYTVTIRGGLGVPGTDDVMVDDFVFQFETSDTERTGNVPVRSVLNFTRKVSEVSATETPALQMYASQGEQLQVPAAVYRYQDLDGFLAALREFQDIPSWANVTRDSFSVETDGLELVTTFEAAVEPLGQFEPFGQFGNRVIQFPEPLPEGLYLLQIEFEGHPVQAWLQVTDVATYLSVSRGKTLVWVNDLAIKGPLQGARVEYLGTNAEAETDDEGIAFFDTPAELLSSDSAGYGYNYTETSGTLLVTAPDGRIAVVPLFGALTGGATGGYYGSGYTPAGHDYWHYISRDRPLYLPSDTVRFWGIAQRRENPLSSETLTVELIGSDYFDYYYRPVRIAEVEVRTSSLGTFTGELSFQGLTPGYYQLLVKVGDRLITSTSVVVETFTKPAYRIDVTPSRQAVFAGEELEFAVKAAFFEGSPVPQLRLRYFGTDKRGEEVTTDERGEASVTVTPRADRAGGPRSTFLEFRPALAEEGEIIGEAWAFVHPASLTISSSSDLADDQGVIEGTVHHVDLSRINDGTAKNFDDYLGASADGVTVSISVNETSWERREVGEYYDFIAKLVRKRYEYDRIDTPLGTFTATTDPQGAFRHVFPVEAEKYYEIELSVTDDAGRVATRALFLSGQRSLFNARSNLVYLAAPGGSANFFGGTQQYALGDEVELEMRRGADVLPSGGENSYLFYQAQNGLREYSVQADATLRFAFDEADVPSTTVLGVWFSGRTYVEVRYGYQLRFDPAERELDIEVTPSEERYEPGDTVTIDLLVTDRDGQPQPGAEVNLAVVDEAIFQLQGPFRYTQDVLPALYSPVGPGILRTYASHQYPNDEQLAERGGNGGARRDFADVAFYGSVSMDSDGRASISFDLPDNLTSWRVTAQGFTAELKAGTALRQIPVGLPFFVDVTMSDEYLVSDRPVIKLRSFGRELKPGQEVSFEVTAPSLGLTEPVLVTAQAFEAVRVPLPELREGEHELLIAGASGDLSDSLVRAVRVVPSRLVAGEARFYQLETGLDIEGSTVGRTRLVFSDHERGRYFPLLRRLSWGYGDRVDQMLARDLAAELTEAHFDQVEVRGEEFDASLYQAPGGGVGLFPYADGDLVLSARIAALASDRVGRTGLISYFLTITENRDETRERQLIALYGLAALGEPVLVPLQTLLGEEDLSWRERLYLGLAAQELGDDTTAGTVYHGLLDDYGESRAPLHRLRVGSDQDDILEATALAAILGAGLGDDLAPALFDYTSNNYTEDILIELEQISYLAQVLPRLSPVAVRFAYTLDGERREVELGRGESFTLEVTPQQLADIQVEQIDGRVGVAASFTAPLNRADIETDPDISVTRRYGGPVVLEEGSLVLITLDVELGPQALDGCYQVTDLLPSGLRPVTAGRRSGFPLEGLFPYRVEGQRVSFCVFDTPVREDPKYYARVVSTGEYTAEPAVIQSMKSAESINLSARDQVEIR